MTTYRENVLRHVAAATIGALPRAERERLVDQIVAETVLMLRDRADGPLRIEYARLRGVAPETPDEAVSVAAGKFDGMHELANAIAGGTA